MTLSRYNYYSLLCCVIILTSVLCGVLQVQALPVSHYAEQSVLSSGRWVKIATTERGVHRIDAATLQQWGFTDASAVSVYGKNGYMLPETFSEVDGDDLQPIAVYVENGDLYFYATGSTQWTYDASTSYWHHTNNYYSNISYYFLTQDRTPIHLQSRVTDVCEGTSITSFDEYALHENEDICIGQTGRLYLGEDLINNNSLTFNLPGVEGDKMTLHIALGANASTTRTLIPHYNGSALSPTMVVGASDSYTYLKEANNYYTVAAADEFTLSFTSKGAGSIKSYYLDFVRMFYTRSLVLNDAQMQFRSTQQSGDYYALDVANRHANNIRVWDITDTEAPVLQQTAIVDGKVTFKPQEEDLLLKEYVAYDITDTLAIPQFVCQVEPQNLHGIDYIPDMVIISTRYFMKEAERIAQIHRDTDNMKVLVCDQLSVFNEFSGGIPDATAIRRLMKMFYDRAQAGYGSAPRYLLLYGRSSYNNRAIAPNMHNEDNMLLVTYQSETSTDQRYSYISDDYFGILGDNTGYDISMEKIDLGIGRMPIKSLEESKKVYNKLVKYMSQKPSNNMWKNKACFIGLNGDNNLHVHQMNTVSLESVENEQEHIVPDKVYLNAYNSRPGAEFEGAQEQIFRDLEEGAFIYSYMGHAGHVSLGSNLIGINHAKSMRNDYWPVFITATCDVCPFDKDENSVGEELFRNDQGGFIALYTTTRTVYTNGNEDINRELLRELFVPAADGKIRLGDVMRRAKESLLYNEKGNLVSDPNKLKYCLIGDPALALPLPTYRIEIERINGVDMVDDVIVKTPANSEVTLVGKIYNEAGEFVPDYNGTLCYEVYDAEVDLAAQESIATPGGNITIKENFGLRQYKLVVAADTIVDGCFTTKFRMPSQTLQSDTTGLITLYAYNTDMNIEAAGFSKNIHVYGVDDAVADATAPTIDNIWIGDDTFSEGDVVAPNSLFHCDVSDNESGITNNEVALGRSMTLLIDGRVVCNDLSGYYSPIKGSAQGSIDYTLKGLEAGMHTVTIRLFDNAGNASEATISFVIDEIVSPQYELHIAEDPVIDKASLSIDGVVEESMIVRYVVVERATGREVWSVETPATEIVWDMTTSYGKALPGEYMVYALVGVGDNKFVTEQKKIIVLGQ
ncbi:MAG: type IX secretion system sortase PorU [Bacteroidales bacterium]|nr:type IX secretion system sortase PorU [Bacteroidales bacterium]